MSKHPLSKIIDGFHPVSYHAGINMTFAEVVNAGCKKLALSSPYSHEFADEMLEATRYASEVYKVVLYVEPELLVTRLFPRDVARDKTVILIAQSEEVLEEYRALKKLKEKSDAQGNPDEVETEIAERFGALLSYSPEKIQELLNRNG